MSDWLYRNQRFSSMPALRILLCGKYIALSPLIDNVFGFIVITKIRKSPQSTNASDRYFGFQPFFSDAKPNCQLFNHRSVVFSFAAFFVFTLLFCRSEGDQFLGIAQRYTGREDCTCPFNICLGERLLIGSSLAGERKAEIAELAQLHDTPCTEFHVENEVKVVQYCFHVRTGDG